MRNPSVDSYLTAHLRTCADCGVTQPMTVLHQKHRTRSLKPGRAGDLKHVGGGNFKRLPDTPAEQLTEKEVMEGNNAPWYCNDKERCIKSRIELGSRPVTHVGDIAQRTIERILKEANGPTTALEEALAKRRSAARDGKKAKKKGKVGRAASAKKKR